MLFDRLIDFRNRIARGVPGPWDALLRIEDADFRFCAALHGNQIGQRSRRILVDQPAAQRVRIGHRGGQADRLDTGNDAPQPRKAERQQMAALRRHQRMQLVEHDVAQSRKEASRIRRCQQQRQLLRRREQDIGRRQLLALPLVRGRIAGPRLHGDWQADLGDRLAEIALDIYGKRLQRRDIERVDPAKGFAGPAFRPGGEIDQGRQETRQRLAGSGRCDQQHRAPGLGTRQEVDLMGARRPAALREPVEERSGQARRGCFGFDGPQLRHAPGVARRISAAKQNLEQKGIMPCDLKRRTLGQGREGGTKLFGGFHDPPMSNPCGSDAAGLAAA